MRGSRVPTVAVVAFVAAAAALVFAAVRGDRPPDPTLSADGSQEYPSAGPIQLRSAAKEVVARDVVAGRTSLPEAAALFAYLDTLCTHSAPEHFVLTAAGHEGLSDGGEHTAGEALCLQVMLWAVRQAGPGPAARQALTARLREEYRAARRSGALADLPPVPEAACREVLDQAADVLAVQTDGRGKVGATRCE